MGGTAIGHLAPDGRWIDGEALTAVEADGAPLPRIPLFDSQTRTFPLHRLVPAAAGPGLGGCLAAPPSPGA
jgi:hypothetical protein